MRHGPEAQPSKDWYFASGSGTSARGEIAGVRRFAFKTLKELPDS
jgi:hypothetical protein